MAPIPTSPGSSSDTSGKTPKGAAGPERPTSTNGPDTPLAGGRFLLGTGLLVVAVATSAVLTFQQISRANIPGCGPGSACGELAASVWGKVPIVDWPVSFLGLAYFAGLLVAWIAVRGVAGNAMRWVIRAGALASLLFIGVMAVKWTICYWCLGAHMANLAFLALVEVTGRRGMLPAGAALSQLRWQGASALTIVFLAGTLAIAVVDQQAARSAGQQQEQEWAASIEQMMGGGNEAFEEDDGIIRADESEADPPVQQVARVEDPEEVESEVEEPATETVATREESEPDPAPAQPVVREQPPQETQAQTTRAAPEPRGVIVQNPRGFTGRVRWGPERASIRIVKFTGYQCPDCRMVDAQVKEVLQRWPDLVSFSIKHFPLSNQCNPHMPTNLHGNACWAARASEAAAILGGFEGFERVHNWLYEQGGSFTDQSLPISVRQLGFEPRQFENVMTSQETLRRVQADIEEGIQYGLAMTPMIFINGVELRGWRADRALIRAVESMAQNPPTPRTAEHDQPLGAMEKVLADWRQEPNQGWPSRQQPWGIGPKDAPVQVQLFGDLVNQNTARAHKAIMEAMSGREDVRYEFRYFPFDQACNPFMPRTGEPHGCVAARAAEAAGQMSGEHAYWRMVDWLMENHEGFSGDALSRAASDVGLMVEPLRAYMEAPQVVAAIEEDASIGGRLGPPRMPRLHVNGRLLARWELQGENILGRILDEAARNPR